MGGLDQRLLGLEVEVAGEGHPHGDAQGEAARAGGDIDPVDRLGTTKFRQLFHWKPLQGLQSVVWNEAVKINGADPDFHRRDLWEAIEAGEFPEWELGLQVFTEEQA